jgi:hypothetical protein
VAALQVPNKGEGSAVEPGSEVEAHSGSHISVSSHSR